MGDRADGGEGRADDDHLGDVLRVVSSVLSGIAAGLSFAEIVDVAGDELRVMLGTDNIGISWFERSTNLLHEQYVYEHGVRLDLSPEPPSPAFLDAPTVTTCADLRHDGRDGGVRFHDHRRNRCCQVAHQGADPHRRRGRGLDRSSRTTSGSTRSVRTTHDC